MKKLTLKIIKMSFNLKAKTSFIPTPYYSKSSKE